MSCCFEDVVPIYIVSVISELNGSDIVVEIVLLSSIRRQRLFCQGAGGRVLFEKLFEYSRDGVDCVEGAERDELLLLGGHGHAVECAVKVREMMRIVVGMCLKAA